MKKLMPVIMAVLMVLSVYMLFSERLEAKNSFETFVQQARELGDTGVVMRSSKAYDDALAIKEDFDIEYERVEMFHKNGHFNSAMEYAEQLKEKYPKNVRSYELLLQLTREKEDYDDFFKLVKESKKRKLSSETIDKMVAEVRYVYELGYSSFDDVKIGSGGFWAVKKKDMWGYADASGSFAISNKFKTAMPFIGTVAAVEEADGSWYYIDTAGNKTLAPAVNGTITELGAYLELTAIAVDGKYGYYTNKYEHKFGSYDFAGNISDGLCAVKNEDVWQIMQKTGEPLLTTEFVDVILDEKDVAVRNERLFVAEEEGKYYMINKSGNKVSDSVYENAQLFLSKDPAAVQIDGKWGFVDTEGKIVIEPQYDDALSFVNGFAAVCKDGQWGYINTANEACVDFQFDGALNFNESGVSFVCDGEDWVPLKLFNTTY